MNRHPGGGTDEAQARDPVGMAGGGGEGGERTHGVADQRDLALRTDQLGQAVGDGLDRPGHRQVARAAVTGQVDGQRVPAVEGEMAALQRPDRMVHAGAMDEQGSGRFGAKGPAPGGEVGGHRSGLLCGAERAVEVGGDVAWMLEADREADHVVAQADGGQLLGAELDVGGRGRVDDQGLGVADIGQMRGHAAALDEPGTRGSAALDSEADDGAGALGQEAGSQGVVGVFGQAGVDDPGDGGMGPKEGQHGRRVGHVALHAQGQGLDAE